LKSKYEGQDDEEIYHGSSSHGVDPGHVGMAGGIFDGHFSRQLYHKGPFAERRRDILLDPWNVGEGRIGDVETVGDMIDVQARTHKAILKPREEPLDPHSGRIPRIVEEKVMEVTVSESVFIGEYLVMTAQPSSYPKLDRL
jgi:hypothetical protein